MALADKLAEYSETPDGLTCTYLTPAHRAAAAELHEMDARGRHDDAHRRASAMWSAAMPRPTRRHKTLIVGSHYDTVLNAGKYDGRLGILTGAGRDRGHASGPGEELPFHVDLIAFSEEEGVRFSAPYHRHRSAIAGTVRRELLSGATPAATASPMLIAKPGFDPDAIGALARRPRGPRRLYRTAYRAGAGAAAARICRSAS